MKILAGIFLLVAGLSNASSQPEFFDSVDRSLQFGPFRPGLLHGVTGSTSTGSRFKTGILWMPMTTANGLDEFRHECEMNHMLYDYEFNDPFHGSSQVIRDHLLTARIQFSPASGGFSTRVTVDLDRHDDVYSVFYYIYGSHLSLDSIDNGDLPFDVSAYGSADILRETSLLLQMPAEFQVHNVKEVLRNHFIRNLQSSHRSGLSLDPLENFLIPEDAGVKSGDGNLFLFQVIFSGHQLKLDIQVGLAPSRVDMKSVQERFNTKFSKAFSLGNRGFSSLHLKFARTTFSNLIGGLGMFQGDARISSRLPSSITNSTVLKLLSFSPSRPFFPRGFLWDEGFHQLLAVPLYPSLSLHMINGWLDLMDSNGWIMREVILGDEARARVPAEFQLQFADYANPPSLIFPVLVFLKRYRETCLYRHSVKQCPVVSDSSLYFADIETVTEIIQTMYKKFKKHFEWLIKTQKGTLPTKYHKRLNECPRLYRWRGRTAGHCLTSGLDDYPRASPSKYEMHVDLVSWIGFYASSLSTVSSFLGHATDTRYFDDILSETVKSLDCFWKSQERVYADLTANPETQQLDFAVHKGYISLFPFMFNLAPRERTSDYLNLLRELTGSCGVRSLHSSDPNYRKGEDYWRGKIWININYLILRSLKLYHWAYSKEARELYSEIRSRLIECVFEVYQDTGYVFEQYDDIDTAGRRSRPFTGWSSLIVLIMSEDYS
eukprot:Partr_v1_DN28627_c3_g1_i3_m49438 putative mannosyl-oligosaccharide glucosidase